MSAIRNDIADHVSGLIARVHEKLLGARAILVVSHIDPDGDALGTQLAFGQYLKECGKTVYLVRDSEVPEKYRFLPDVASIVLAGSLPDNLEIDTALVLECPVATRAGSAVRFLKDSVTVVHIDHHSDSTPHGDINWIDIATSSVGEMAYEYFTAVGYHFDERVATQLYTAILTDTGRFRYASTSPRTMAIAGELIARGASPRDICDAVYFDLPASTTLLMGKVLASMEFYNHGRICVFTLTQAMLDDSGASASESDGLVDYTLFTRGVVTGALLKEISDSRTKVSLRSSDGVNVAQIAAVFGGGGHFNAAGCELPLPLDRARTEIVRLLTEADVHAG
jgi:bifunctional oligoribonuclease and PAP phosphatase NrnA